MPTPLTDAMFLCTAMAEIVPLIRKEHCSAFKLAEDLNIFANRQVFATHMKKTDLQQVLVSSLLPRMLTAFQGGVITGERGLSAELKLLTRKVVEVTFRIVAIARNKEVADKYLKSDEVNRRKFLNKLRLLRSVKHSPEEVATIDTLHAEVTANINAEAIQDLSLQWYADKAGMSDFYNTAYAYLSESAHANVRDLDALIEKDPDGEIEVLRYGPDNEGIGDDLCIGIECVIISLDAASSVLPDFDLSGIDVMRKRMTTLFEEFEK